MSSVMANRSTSEILLAKVETCGGTPCRNLNSRTTQGWSVRASSSITLIPRKRIRISKLLSLRTSRSQPSQVDDAGKVSVNHAFLSIIFVRNTSLIGILGSV